MADQDSASTPHCRIFHAQLHRLLTAQGHPARGVTGGQNLARILPTGCAPGTGTLLVCLGEHSDQLATKVPGTPLLTSTPLQCDRGPPSSPLNPGCSVTKEHVDQSAGSAGLSSWFSPYPSDSHGHKAKLTCEPHSPGTPTLDRPAASALSPTGGAQPGRSVLPQTRTPAPWPRGPAAQAAVSSAGCLWLLPQWAPSPCHPLTACGLIWQWHCCSYK